VNSNGSIAASGGVDQSMVTRTDTGRFLIDLGDDATANDGLLFAIANANANLIVQTGVLEDGTWDLRVQDNASEFSDIGVPGHFSFVYLPFDTEGLIGGRYDGASDTQIDSVGDFTFDRLGEGRYELTIPGETPETGLLLLTVANQIESGGVFAPDDNLLTYEASGTGTFLINSYDLPGLDFQDTGFVWAYIDFSNPIGLVTTVPEPTTSVVLFLGIVFGSILPRGRRVRS